MNKNLSVVSVLIYNLIIIFGTIYMIQVFDWSVWWLLAAYICLMSFEKKEKVELSDQTEENKKELIQEKEEFKDSLDPEKSTTIVVEKRRSRD
jgi:Ca2+/Na+ antiporter